jgi:hypothetical protein
MLPRCFPHGGPSRHGLERYDLSVIPLACSVSDKMVRQFWPRMTLIELWDSGGHYGPS